MTSRWVLVVLSSALLLHAPVVSAAGAEHKIPGAGSAADASRYFQAGQKAFDQGRFEEAAQAFEQAFRIKPNPAPLINAGDAWEKAGEYAKAARDFQKVIHLKQSTDQDRTDAVDRLARLKPELGTIELLGKPALRARIDDEEFHGGEDVFVYPGAHKVTLVDVPRAEVRTIRVDAGTARSVDLASLVPAPGPLKPGPETKGPARTPQPGGISPLTWTAYGVGALGAFGTIYFGLQANSAANAFDARPNRQDYDRFNQSKLLTNISLGVGIVGVGVGTVLLLRDLRRSHLAPENDRARIQRPGVTNVGIAPIHSGGMVLTSGRF